MNIKDQEIERHFLFYARFHSFFRIELSLYPLYRFYISFNIYFLILSKNISANKKRQ